MKYKQVIQKNLFHQTSDQVQKIHPTIVKVITLPEEISLMRFTTVLRKVADQCDSFKGFLFHPLLGWWYQFWIGFFDVRN